MNTILTGKDTETVLKILADELGVEKQQLTNDSRLQEDLGADSLSVVEIIMRLEEELNITIPDEQFEKVSTVQDVMETIAFLMQSQGITGRRA